MRTIGSALLATTMIVSSAFAATDSVGPLAPGKPAGVKKAQAEDTTLLWVLGAGLVIGGIVLVATQGDDKTPTGTTSSSGTSP
jgi:hypothetical protein